MKKCLFILCVALALFSLPQWAVALDTVDPQYGATGDNPDYGPYQAGSGGEFTLLPAGPFLGNVASYYGAKTSNIAVKGTFQSFCLEEGEYLRTGIQYAYINNKAVQGGVGPAGDPISLGTAFLYAKFAAGTLSGYDYDTVGGRKVSARALQNAIWDLEGEIAAGTGINAAYEAMLITQFGSVAAARADNNDLFNVAVLNLYYAPLTAGAAPQYAQDVLILTPEPMTMLLFALGLVGLAGLRRKE